MAAPLKDQFDAGVVATLAERFAAASTDFDAGSFTSTVDASLVELELKDRINLVSDALAASLPEDYPTALATVVQVAESGVEGFAAWPLCSFVERHGLAEPELSLEMMERLTRRWSCEFAIRPFLDTELDLTRTFLRRWVHHDDEAVRRLASEGTRPRLPWGPRVQALLDDPEIGIELLTELRHDPSETVRRSVANHLNDIARDHPDRVVEITARWASDPLVDPRMIRHALRSLVKAGDAGALAALGFTTDPEISVGSFVASPGELSLGDELTLDTTITSTAESGQRLVVDFVIHHVAANGSTSPKVFKWTTVELGPGEVVELVKRRRIATASTRRYHAGEHRVDLQVAGEVVASARFQLLDGS